MSQDLRLEPRIADLGTAVVWLDGQLTTTEIAAIFGVTEAHVRQLRYRAGWQPANLQLPAELIKPLIPPADPFASVPDELRELLRVRPKEDSITVVLNGREKLRLELLENQIERLGSSFWSGVRFGAGIKPLHALLAYIGRPAHPRRIRTLARLRQLIAESYVHTGYSRSAIEEGLKSLHLSRVAFEDSGEASDLESLAKTALLISQAHLLRQEPARAKVFLDMHQQARARIRLPLGGEYRRQRGAVAFQRGDDEIARKWFGEATNVFSETIEYGRPKQRYEILTIGQRQTNLLGTVDWDGSQELLEYMLKATPPGDIHVSMSINWTAACGFSINSPSANQRASELLEASKGASLGFGHQATVAWLLGLSPKIPASLRREWVRFALYFNAFRNK
jgi:hypothetical protein